MAKAALAALLIILAGCSSPAPADETTVATDDAPESGNLTAGPNQTAVRFELLVEVVGAPDQVSEGTNVTVRIDSTLSPNATANATWAMSVMQNGTEVQAFEGVGLAASHTFAPLLGKSSADITVTAPGYVPANATIDLPLVVPIVLNPADAAVVLVDETFSGNLPVSGSVEGSHTFDVPPGGVYVRFTYTSDHIGLFTAVARLTDATGASVFYTLDDCGFGTTGAATDTCVMEKAYEMPPGTWSTTVSWQVGQVTENYTLRVEGYTF